MQLSHASLLTSLLAALALASPLSRTQRRAASGPCFHAGSDALCCAKPALQIDQFLETNCTVPRGPIDSPGAFRKTCEKAHLEAFCCLTGNNSTGLICAPSSAAR